MPCRSDYMDPSQAESDSRDTAQLILFVHKKLGSNSAPPKWVKTVADQVYGNPARLNELVVMLCGLCSNMTTQQQSDIIYNGRDSNSRKLADWWDKHEAADKQRREEEQLKASLEAIAKEVTSVLTKDQLELLVQAVNLRILK